MISNEEDKQRVRRLNRHSTQQSSVHGFEKAQFHEVKINYVYKLVFYTVFIESGLMY